MEQDTSGCLFIRMPFYRQRDWNTCMAFVCHLFSLAQLWHPLFRLRAMFYAFTKTVLLTGDAAKKYMQCAGRHSSNHHNTRKASSGERAPSSCPRQGQCSSTPSPSGTESTVTLCRHSSDILFGRHSITGCSHFEQI